MLGGLGMKKLLMIVICILMSLLFMISFYAMKTTYFNQMFYSGVTQIMVSNIYDLSDDTILSKINSISKKEDVNIAKYVYPDSDSVKIFSVDTTFSGKVRYGDDLRENSYSTNVLNEDKKAIQFKYPFKDIEIKIYNIKNLVKYSFGGSYMIFTDSSEQTEKIVKMFNDEIGITEIYATYDDEVSLFGMLNDIYDDAFEVLVLFIICLIVIVLIVLKIILSKSRTVSVLSINGYSMKGIIFYLLWDLKYTMLCSYVFSVIIVVIQVSIFSNMNFFINALCLHFGFFLAIFVFLAIMITIITKIMLNKYNAKELINNFVIFKSYYYFQVFFKFVIIALMLALLSNTVDVRTKLNEYKQSNSVWEQAENVYRIRSTATGSRSDLEQFRVLEKKAKKIYNEFQNNKKLFLLCTQNYQLWDEESYLWEWNYEQRKYSSKSITVNNNYLEMNPIMTYEGHDVREYLIWNDTIFNVLLPKSLMKYEEAIKKELVEYFAFRTIEVSGIYQRHIGEDPIDLKKGDIKINVVYISDNVTYFTYNERTASLTDNIIIDNPIVIVDTLNVDDSYYYAWLTNSVYLKSETAEPIMELLPSIEKYDMLASYHSLKAVYNLRADAIRMNTQKIYIIYFVLLILLGLLLLIIYSISALYFEQNKRQIFIKYILGFRIMRLLRNKFVIEFTLYMLIIAIPDTRITYKLYILVFDLVVNLIFVKLLMRKSINNVIKGGV